jgi:hypothetical protein
MTQIRFDSGTIVTIRNGFIEAPSAALTALLDMLAATLPPFAADAEIAGAIIDKIGVGKIVRPDHPRARARPLELGLRARRRQR